MTRPARSLTGATPVSRTATLTPAPLLPAWKALPACDVQTYDDELVVSSHEDAKSLAFRSAVTAVTPGCRLSSTSRSAGTVAETPSMIGSGASVWPPTFATAQRTEDSAPEAPETTTWVS